MAAFHVYAAWVSETEVPPDSILNLEQNFRPGDSTLATWIDEANPRRFVLSFDVDGQNYEDAARECLDIVDAVARIEPSLGTLGEVGISDEYGALIVGSDDFDRFRHLPQ